MRKWVLRMQKKAALSAAAAFMGLLLWQALCAFLRIRAGTARFAGQETGFLAWERGRGKGVWGSTEYQPGCRIRPAIWVGAHAVTAGLLGLWGGRRKR